MIALKGLRHWSYRTHQGECHPGTCYPHVGSPIRLKNGRRRRFQEILRKPNFKPFVSQSGTPRVPTQRLSPEAPSAPCSPSAPSAPSLGAHVASHLNRQLFWRDPRRLNDPREAWDTEISRLSQRSRLGVCCGLIPYLEEGTSLWAFYSSRFYNETMFFSKHL